jgi:hypothetical protein
VILLTIAAPNKRRDHDFIVADHVVAIHPGILKHVTRKGVHVSAMEKSENLNCK